MLAVLPIFTPVFLALRNLRVRWLRTLLTMLGIVIGVAVIVAIAVANASTLASIRMVFDEASGYSNLLVENTAIGADGLDDSYVDQVANFPDVIVAAPTVVQYTIPLIDAAAWQYSFGLGGVAVGNELQLTGIDPEIDPQVRHYRLLAGRLLEPGEETYSIVLVKDYADEKGFSVGEDFALLTPTGSARLRIVGLIAKEGPGLANNGVAGFAPLPVVQDLFSRAGRVDAIDVVVPHAIADDPQALSAFKTRLNARLGRGATVSLPAARGELTAARLQTYQTGLDFFSVVALFVGAFLIYNAFAMTVVERTREIGMLRTLGLTRAQTLVLVLSEAVGLGLAGSLAGVGFGLVLARGLMDTMSLVSGTAVDVVSVPPGGLLDAGLVGIGVTLAAALAPALQASRISPMQALHAAATADENRWVRQGWRYGPATVLVSLALIFWVPLRESLAFPIGAASIFVMLFGVTLCVPLIVAPLERLFTPLVGRLYGAPGMLGARNVHRARGRTTLTVAALMVGIAMIVGISGMTGGFRQQINGWIQAAVGGDLIVRSPLRMCPQIGAQIAAVPGVAVVAPAAVVGVRRVPPEGEPADAARDALLFAAVDLDTYLQMNSFQFEQGDEDAALARLRQGGAVLIATTIAQRYHLAPGDVIRCETPRGRHDFTVAGVVTEFTANGMLMYGTLDDLRLWFGITGADRFVLKLAPDADRQAIEDAIRNGIGKSRHLTVESNDDFKRRILEFTDQTFALFDVLALIGVVVAALGVINTMLMNVLERRREIGALRSLGMTRGQVARMILAESGMLGLIGGLFGILAGLLLAQVFSRGVGAINGFRIEAVFPGAAVAGGAVIALLVSQVAALWPAWRAAAVNIISAVKHE
jgi:putative ABC transport system permease protein